MHIGERDCCLYNERVFDSPDIRLPHVVREAKKTNKRTFSQPQFALTRSSSWPIRECGLGASAPNLLHFLLAPAAVPPKETLD